MSHRSIAETIIGSVVQASAPAVSPDGSLIAFVVTRTDLSENTYKSQVWLTSTDGAIAPHPVTGGDHDGQPAWSHDGTSLAFTSRRGEKDNETTLHVLPVGRTGEVRTIATMPDGVGTPRFSPDGQYVAFTSRTRDPRYDAKDESWQAPRKIERFFSRLDNEGWIVDRPQHVHIVRTDGSAPPRNLTPGPFQHDGIAWTPDSSGIVTSAQRHDTWDLDFATDLYLVGLDGTITALTAQTGVYQQPSVSPDGTTVAFLGMDDSSTFPQNIRVGIVPITGGPHRFVSSALDRTFQTTAGWRPPVWTGDSTLLGTAEDRGETHLFEVRTDGAAPVPRTSGAITVKSFDAAAGTIAATIGSVDAVADLFVIDADAPRRVTDFAARYAQAADPQSWERIVVPSTDGTVEIDAWIMRPVDFDPSQSYPVIVNVHGGPYTQYGENLFDEAQFQAAAGFVVVMCNPRGGSGREATWGQAIMGPKHPVTPGTGWGTVDVDDVLAVLDHVLATMPFCDPDRVGMQGGSYGGFMATWLAGHHGERFRAICSERAVNNMLSEEWSSDIGSMFRVEHGPSHLDDPDAYLQISPVRWARDIHVPMLLLHSENDLRCPINQAEELFMALRLLGRDVTFYRFPGEGHELSRSGSPVHRVQRAEIILDFFAEKLAPAS
ncbi:MAG: prolyl oligopeptidase family serine peptidase [Ilumatobacteraceae bacterium]